ncbi:hypothetical protein C8R45DRAFT_826035, partial [Mycena sanguinolenta]
IFTTSSSGTVTPSTTSSQHTAIPSAGFDARVQPPPHPAPSKLTPSQQFFAILTHTDPRAFKNNQGAEFFLFMDLRAELQWKSYEMTPKKWADSTITYNTRLQFRPGYTAPKKRPRALMDKLCEMEPKIMQCLTDRNFQSKCEFDSLYYYALTALANFSSSRRSPRTFA